MDSVLLNRNVKDEVDIKEEILDFTNYELESEDSEQCKLRNTSNPSQTTLTTGVVEFPTIYIKEEEVATDPLSEAGFSFSQNKHPEEALEEESVENKTKVECELGEANSVQHRKGLNIEKEEEKKKKKKNCVKKSERVGNDVQRWFQCHFCSYRTNRNCDLKKHLTVHSNLKPFKCPHCDSAFNDNSNLYQHIVIHSDLKPFKCSHCQSRFKRNKDLKDHLFVHSDVKPFKCSYCELTFKRKKTLLNHLVMHKCSYCESEFKLKKDLKAHLLLHSEGNHKLLHTPQILMSKSDNGTTQTRESTNETMECP